MSQNSYLRELCAQVSQNVFLADLNVSRRVCAQVSQIDLNVLRLITTVLAKWSQYSYLREYCAQVSQNSVHSLF